MESGTKTAIIMAGAIAIAVAAISISFSFMEKADIQISKEFGIESIDRSKLRKAPELQGIAGYINTTPEQLKKDMEDKVIVYDIWTYSCINCIRTLPYVTAWYDKYADDGLIIIGIHSPEFEFEKNIENVKMAVEKYGIKYPVVLDNDMKTWDAFENRYWPRKYVVDHQGYIRYDHIGEGAYEQTEQIIQTLLKERAMELGISLQSKSLVDLKEFEHSDYPTPEIYFGYKFAEGRNRLGAPQKFMPDSSVQYSLPLKFDQHRFYLDGKWENLPSSMRLVSEVGEIVLSYRGKEVNIVAGNNAVLDISLDGKPLPKDLAGTDTVNGTKMVINEHRLYNVVNSQKTESHLLKIKAFGSGFEIFTFTFG